MHDLPHLPHYITSPMHQCMFIIFKQSRTPINQQRDETKQNKIKERDKDSRIHKIGQIGAKTCGKKHTHTHTQQQQQHIENEIGFLDDRAEST